MARAPKASAGDSRSNSAIDDEHQQALHIGHHVPAYEKALAAKKAAAADFLNVCKLIKAEGGSLAEVKGSIELRTPEGEAKLKANIESQLKVARWNGLAIGTQADMFAPDPRPLKERAFDEGKRAGMAGEPLNPPASYSPGTDGDIGFKEGWHHGQTLLAQKSFKPTPAGAGSGLIQAETKDGPDDFDKEETAPVGEPPAAGDPPAPPANDWPDEVAAQRSKKGKQQPKGAAV